MHRSSSALIAAVAIVLAPLAFAADMPVKAPPLAAAPASSGFWLQAEYLHWRTRGDSLPALVTTATQGGFGALGAPDTVVLFGQSKVLDDWRSGARVRAGYWLDPGRTIGIVAHGFGLGEASRHFFASSDGTTVLAQPFLNAQTNAQDAVVLASPLTGPGQVSVGATSQLLGAGLATSKELCSACAFGSVSGHIGYRYLRLRDRLEISSVTTSLLLDTLAATDRFATRNDFHGLDLGLGGTTSRGPWIFEWLAKVAVGATLTDISVNGSTTTTTAGVTTVVPGGFLALSSNMGRFSRQRLSIVPELDARIAYQVTPQLRASLGYNVIYWTDVVRPGGVIDTTVDPDLIPPVAGTGTRPAPRADASAFWAHGVTGGLRYAF